MPYPQIDTPSTFFAKIFVISHTFCVYRTRGFVYSTHMGSAFVDCWKCDVCGWRWIKGEIWPSHCPSKKCRSRKWNSLSAGASDAVVATRLEVPAPIPTQTIAPEVVSPPMKMNDAMANFLKAARLSTPAASPMPVPESSSFLEDTQPASLCPHEEWAPDGEQYRCRLVAGHKGKCVPGEKVS